MECVQVAIDAPAVALSDTSAGVTVVIDAAAASIVIAGAKCSLSFSEVC